MKIYMSYTKNFLKVCTALYVVAALPACSIFAPSQELADKKPQVFKVAFRQLPPEPVYNRVRLAELPDIKPASTIADSKGTQLNPLVKLSLKNSTLEQAAIALSALGNYQSYAASSIAKQKISLEAYGTLDEIAHKIAIKSGSHVVVDHHNRQIRILKQEPIEPEIAPSFAGENKARGVIVSK